jgi:hypothetical protein
MTWRPRSSVDVATQARHEPDPGGDAGDVAVGERAADRSARGERAPTRILPARRGGRVADKGRELLPDKVRCSRPEHVPEDVHPGVNRPARKSEGALRQPDEARDVTVACPPVQHPLKHTAAELPQGARTRDPTRELLELPRLDREQRRTHTVAEGAAGLAAGGDTPRRRRRQRRRRVVPQRQHRRVAKARLVNRVPGSPIHPVTANADGSAASQPARRHRIEERSEIFQRGYRAGPLGAGARSTSSQGEGSERFEVFLAKSAVSTRKCVSERAPAVDEYVTLMIRGPPHPCFRRCFWVDQKRGRSN